MEQRAEGGNGRRNVLCLGMVSLFTDLSTQMIYPLIPLFLSSLGVSKTVIGVIEGVAESAAALLRTVFGRLSDRAGKRKVFIYLGYGLSALSKPLLFLAGSWQAVFAVKLSDRIGKAMRTPPRDALISTSVDPARRGMAFGFHRAMDRIGAIGGPLLALLCMHFFAGRADKFQLIFLLSFIPAAAALLFIPFARETAMDVARNERRESGMRSRPFVVFLVCAVAFTLGNSSNAFLVLKATECGVAEGAIPLVWVVYNIFCTVSSPVFGTLSDRIGRTPVIMTSFLYYALVYTLFGLCTKTWGVWALFCAYGLYYGLSEGVFRAHIADLVQPEHRATAYGVFNTAIGLALVPASVLFGWVWDSCGSKRAFMLSASFSLLAFIIFAADAVVRRRAGRTRGNVAAA